MKKITVEEHYFTQYFIDYFQSRKEYPRLESIVDERGHKDWRWWDAAQEYHSWLPDILVSKLCNGGEGRLRDMDEDGIDMQVLSFNPPINEFDAEEGTSIVKKVNDIIAEAVKKHPDRFVGCAAVFLKEPNAAADELERAVKQLGFRGTMILSHVEGEYIDAKKYWPVFERAARLDVPVYIHPLFPPPDRLKQYEGYPELVGGMWGYGAETGFTALRLICSGIFDEYPTLQIILGHMGESLPFWLPRLDNPFLRPGGSHTLLTNRQIEDGADPTPLAKKIKRLPSQYMKENFFVATSAMFWQPVLQFVCSVLGADRVLLGVDYPFGSNREAVSFIDSATIPDSDKEKICHLNAEKLFKL